MFTHTEKLKIQEVKVVLLISQLEVRVKDCNKKGEKILHLTTLMSSAKRQGKGKSGSAAGKGRGVEKAFLMLASLT